MKYFLFLFIVGSPTDAPEQPEEFSNLADCEKALNVAYNLNERLKKTSMKRLKFAGICLPETATKRIMEEWKGIKDDSEINPAGF